MAQDEKEQIPSSEIQAQEEIDPSSEPDVDFAEVAFPESYPNISVNVNRNPNYFNNPDVNSQNETSQKEPTLPDSEDSPRTDICYCRIICKFWVFVSSSN